MYLLKLGTCENNKEFSGVLKWSWKHNKFSRTGKTSSFYINRVASTVNVQSNQYATKHSAYKNFTYSILTPWCTVLLEKLTGFQLVKKFPAFYGTRSFITTVTSAHHLSLSWANSIQSTPPHPTSWRSILISSSHLRLGLLPSGFPTKTLYTPVLSPIQATCPAHLILLYFITRRVLGDQYRSLSSSKI